MAKRREGFGFDFVEDFEVEVRCRNCGLGAGCKSFDMPLTGEGRLGVLVVGEAPGVEEDKQGVQLVGPSGQFFRRVLREEVGVDLDRDCWKTNAVRCFPGNAVTPDGTQVEACRLKLLEDVERLNPRVILLLGGIAVRSLIGHLWKQDTGGITKWVGWKIPYRKWNCWICPTYHPAYLLRQQDEPVLEMFFRRHVREAFGLGSRPFSEGKVKGDFIDEVECLFESRRAASVLEDFVSVGGVVAVDFETDRLKPDSEEARILTAAVCWRGKRTIAFPVVGEAVDGLCKLLVSDLPKIGWNIKFEDRWARKVLGVEVKNWVWDGMLAAHVLDNRSDITGLKFQALVLLGVEPWDLEVRKYKVGEGGNVESELRRVDLRTLLVYNGLDALYTYWVAVKQRKMLGEAKYDSFGE